MKLQIDWVVRPGEESMDERGIGAYTIVLPEESFRDPKFHAMWEHAVLCPNCRYTLPNFFMSLLLERVSFPQMKKFYDDVLEAQTDAIGRLMVDPDTPNAQVREAVKDLFTAYHKVLHDRMTG